MDVEGNKQKYRGKLYILNDAAAWQEAGTGHASVVGTGQQRRLQFKDEDSGQVLHDRPVFAQDVYQLQGEGAQKTIIVWEDEEDQKDWALSFQDEVGSQEIYKLICHEPSEQKRMLPPPKLPNLQELARKLQYVAPGQREGLAAELVSEEFVQELRESFHSAEDLQSLKDLSFIFQIVKGVFLFATHNLTERYLAEDVYEDVLGMLELDESLPPEKRMPHRQVIKERVKYNDVVSFEDEETVRRIHLNYRLLYLKDIVLPRQLDDAAFASLQQLIHTNLTVILEHLQKGPELLEGLLKKVGEEDMQSLLFLQDACRLSRQIPPTKRQELYNKMAAAGLFDTLAVYFNAPAERDGEPEGGVRKPAEHPAQHHAVEVLLLHATCHPGLLRNWLLQENNEAGQRVLRVLIQLMVHEEDQGVQSQIFEVLRAVMDPASLEQQEQEKRLDVFYDQGIMAVIAEPLRPDQKRSGGVQVCFAQQLVCEIIAFAVSKHGYRAKVFVIRHGIGQQVCRLLSAPQKYLQLAAVRVLRAIIGTKDEAYMRYVTKNGLLSQLLRSFEQCIMPPALGTNLMASATLELLEFIRSQNLKPLIESIAKNHGPLLQRYGPQIKPLEALLLKYQQNLEVENFPPDQHAGGGPLDGSGQRAPKRQSKSPGRDDSAEDDSYFESLDDPDDEEPPPSPAEARSPSPSAQTGEASPGLPGLLGGYAEAEEEAKESPVNGTVEATAAGAEKARSQNESEDAPPQATPEATEKSMGHASKRLKTSKPQPGGTDS